MQGKVCTKCGEEKPLDAFSKRKLSKDGRMYECKSCICSHKKLWYKGKSQEVLYNNKIWRDNNPEKLKEMRSSYKKNNKSTVNSINSKRRASKNKATMSWVVGINSEFIELQYAMASVMTQMHGIEYHVDHIYPLNGKNSCGLHVPLNLRVIPADDNLKKHNKSPEELLSCSHM